MSIPRRARIFGQPTKLQRDALIGGQDIIYTKKELVWNPTRARARAGNQNWTPEEAPDSNSEPAPIADTDLDLGYGQYINPIPEWSPFRA